MCVAAACAASDNLRQAVWASGTAGRGVPPFRLVVQDDGNVMLFDGADAALWGTNTGGTSAVQATSSSGRGRGR